MKRLLVALVFASLIYPAAAFWQSRDSNYNVAIQTGGGTNNLAIDNTSNLCSHTATSCSVTITTTHTNDILIACTQGNGSAPTGPPTDTASLSWAQVGSGAASSHMYYAASSGTLTGDTISISYSSSQFNTLQVIAISGANFSSPFDANYPRTTPATTTTSTPLSFTTANANDIMVACYAENSGSASAGSLWTGFTGGMTGFAANEYLIVSSTQTGTSASLTTGTIKNGLGTALVSR